MDDPSMFPEIVATFPFAFRIGAVGAGLGLGCGVGVGFGGPINFGALPGLGSVSAGLGSGLGQFGHQFGGVAMGLRQQVQRLGVKGLDAGMGCGVGVGYGFGAGFFLKPSAVEGMVMQTQRCLAWAVSKAQQQGFVPEPPSVVTGFMNSPHVDIPASMVNTMPQHQDASPTAMTAESISAEILRMLLKQQHQIDVLQRQNRALRKAVCKVDATLPICNEDDDEF